MQLKAASESNKFSKLIYGIPVATYEMNFFQRLKSEKNIRKYFKKEILPVSNYLRFHPVSFEDMCEFADFIKQMEMVLFYNNSSSNQDNTKRASVPEEEKKVILMTDNGFESHPSKKTLMILLERENVTIRFTMSIVEEDNVIDVSVHNEFGKKLTTNYHIVNADTDFYDIHQYNLLNNVNYILQNTLADFLEDMFWIFCEKFNDY